VLTNHTGRRLAALTTICASLALGTAATAAAYPITPEGEPLHLNAGLTPPPPAVVPGAGDSTLAGETASIPVNAVPLANVSNDGTDWIETALTVIASIAVLALAMAGLIMIRQLRGSAPTDSRGR